MPDWLRRHAWLWGGISLLLGAVAVAIAIALRSEDPLDTADKLSSMGGLVIGAVGLIVGLLSFAAAIRGSMPPADAWAVAATADLAAQVQRQWRGEQHLRRLDGSDLLQTSWASTTREVAASPADVLAGVIGGRPTKLRLAGTIDKVGSVFGSLPRRRLVVLGEPGAGKSVLALTLTLQLLDARGPDDPVPVLLVLSAWDTREDLESWLVRRLAEEYPSVTPMPTGAATGYRDLLRTGRILPILDGLDELPADLRVRALEALNLAAAQGQAFVLTCRSDEYAALVERTGRPAPGAAVVEITPLTTAAAASYLADARWSGVRDALASGSRAHAALAHALQTPLMLHLARTAYARPGTNPAELLDTARFATSEAIEDHLLTSYLPALYDTEASRPPGRRRPRQTPAKAVARLTYLAQHTGESVSWWNLHEAVRGWPARSAAVAGVALVIALGLFPRGYLIDVGSGMVASTALVVGFVSPMPKVSRDLAPRLPLLRSVVSTGLPVAVAVLLVDGLWIGVFAVMGEPDLWPEFNSLSNILFVGLGYAIGHEIGRSMRDLSMANRRADRKTVRRAAGACTLLALSVYGESLVRDLARPEFEIAAGPFAITLTACAAQAKLPRRHQGDARWASCRTSATSSTSACRALLQSVPASRSPPFISIPLNSMVSSTPLATA